MESESTLAAEPPLIEDDWALFLDVDGSLAEHAPTPDAVRIDPAIKQALPALSRKCGGALALVSGRSVEALDALFDPVHIAAVAGLHGLERRWHAGWNPAPEMDAGFLALAAEAEAIAARFPGALIECRGGCLFLHWRAAPDAAPELGAFAESARTRLPRHRLHPGAHGIEIRPVGMDKGAAIAAFMQAPPFQGRRPAFIGDDPADEPGFAQVNALDGVSVLIGAARTSAARHRLANPGAVRRWLLDSLHDEVLA
ncbi:MULTISPECIES: trehalose-phosphatase [unclassified Pseudoxanthomonas]|uniref:trehalose-phosphatase n=1 Tax=unclassified Pseudoxanthomonas TaxID=2645906 RepID=UPI001621F63C|nr:MULTISPECIES: trehalose-phosphatase [unclassified Pseudoxanthomonas]MBB3274325.1 trehalose 6-phosphate phosphatase [Pseudoxanthomonas sp. OG2]MBV7474832.1 trehalose-phosphatase [Pseudoxanthomonas sp. PXM05]UBB26929.1 trehalose-phosphatase [Pseudoxanthomonas japonensis]